MQSSHKRAKLALAERSPTGGVSEFDFLMLKIVQMQRKLPNFKAENLALAKQQHVHGKHETKI